MNIRLCDSCGQEMFPALEDVYQRRHDDSPGYQGALRIDVNGGYNEYIDHPTPQLIICFDCAEALLKENPWLAKALRPY